MELWILLLVLCVSLCFLLRRKSPESKASPKSQPLPIFFGSQTGTAEHFASELKGVASSKAFLPTVQELNSLSLDVLQALPCVLIICSTQGKGDAPDNAVKFLKSVQTAAKLGEVRIGTAFAVFGLGSLEYMDTFNKCSKAIREALLRLGGRELLEPVFGDDTLDLHADFVTWMDRVLPAVQAVEVGDQAQVQAAMQKKHHFVRTELNVPLTAPDLSHNYERASEQYLGSGTR